VPAAVLALLALVLIAAGCGDDNGGSGGGGSSSAPKSVTVGSDIPYPPFEFGKPPYEGFDIDVVNELAKNLGTKATFKKTPFDTIFRDLAQGKFDLVVSASTITPERQKTVDFSDSYFPADQSLMVKRGSSIKTVDDLDGKVIGAQLGTTGADYAKNKTPAKTVRTYDLIDDAFNALEAGQVEAVVNDCPVSKYAEAAHKDLVVVQAIDTNEEYGIAFQKGSDLRDKFNEALAKLRKNGGLERISNKWFKGRPCVLE
jgi:polar amino acid transport system substrate-binding protein